MDYIKAKNWNGKSLKGDWLLTYKIDGVRALLNDEGNIVSRANKPLYNLDHLKEVIRDHEIYLGSWEASVSAVRTRCGEPVPVANCYDLRPDSFDSRLVIGTFTDPTAALISNHLWHALERGYEGLVLRGPGNRWLRVKPKETHDVHVTGVIEGTGKHEGRLGAIMTPMGKVGTGFTDAQREDLWQRREALEGSIIEVECMQLTNDGKFRHPRFIRERFDK